MSFKRHRNLSSPEQLTNNNYKKQLTTNIMDNQTTPDVFSWDKLCNLLDAKLKDVTRKEDLVSIKTEIEELREENVKLRNDINKLTTRLEYIDRRTRSANIVVSGLNSNSNNEAKNEFTKLCTNVLKVNIHVVNARKLPSKNTFLFTLETNMQAINVIAAKGNLNDGSIFIQKDYTNEEQNVRYNLRQINKAVANPQNNLKVRLGEFCIFINNKRYTWSMGKAVANCNDDAVFLRNLLSEANSSIDVTVRNMNNNVEDVAATSTNVPAQ